MASSDLLLKTPEKGKANPTVDRETYKRLNLSLIDNLWADVGQDIRDFHKK